MAGGATMTDPGERRRETAEKVIEQRRLRRTLFAEELFDETAWELLLRLYVEAPDGAPVPQETLMEEAHARPITARWIRHLEQIELIEIAAGPEQEAAIALSRSAIVRLEAYLDGTADILLRWGA
jgi:hypothetical protein